MRKNFSEDDIRPHKLANGLKKAIQQDVEYLQSKKDKFIKVVCPACGQDDFSFAFKKYNFDFVQCRKCQTVYMNPRATEEILKGYYANSAVYDYWNTDIFPASEEVRREKIVQPRVKKILEICHKNNICTDSLLEVGAGFGTFSEEMQAIKQFKKIIALEPNVPSAESCRSKGLEVIESSVENVKSLPVSPNVVVLFEVIEHLFCPKDFILQCKKFMDSGSIIVVTCPNFYGFDISTLGIVSDNIDFEHINLFNPDSIKILFDLCGFKILELFTPGKLDADIVRNKIIAGEFDVSNNPFLRTILIERWDELGQNFQDFLRENKLSSHMWVVAQKI
jgi:2-polyprenyl-3-methyl-5-hydroxy-6-metoxy-1,4-benzoquinol methylase